MSSIYPLEAADRVIHRWFHQRYGLFLKGLDVATLILVRAEPAIG